MSKFIFQFLVVALLSTVLSCSESSLRRKDSEKNKNLNAEDIISESNEAESRDDLTTLERREDEPLPPLEERKWGVWVRGVGVDAFAGLGFLQQFSESIAKPDRVAGTGMGCWIAASWAIKNNSNYAEWQSFKFDDWSAFKKSFLGTIKQEDAKERFLAYLAKIRSSQKDFVYQIPLECPLFDVNVRALDLAQDLRLEERMFHGFDVDLLSLGEFSDSGYRSGAVFRSHGDAILEALTGGQFVDSSFTWIIVETSANHRLWGSAAAIDHGITKNGVRWIRVPVGNGLDISAGELKDFGLRRKWLLRGRRDAKSHLNNSEVKDFLQL